MRRADEVASRPGTSESRRMAEGEGEEEVRQMKSRNLLSRFAFYRCR